MVGTYHCDIGDNSDIIKTMVKNYTINELFSRFLIYY